MVKQIIGNQGHIDYIKSLVHNSNCTAGLIIGKTGSNKDHIARLVRCPPLVEGEENEWHKVTDVDESWVSGHAAQILPSLPGGVEVIGVFIVTSQAESVKDTRTKLKQMLYRSYRSVTKVQEECALHFKQKKEDSLFWTVAHFDSMKGGALSNCYQFDVKDYKDSGRPVEWKQQETNVHWDYLRCDLILDESVNTTDASNTSDILDQLCLICCKKIASSCVMIDKKQKGSNEVLNPTTAVVKNSKKKKAQHKLSCNDYHCQIFTPLDQVEVTKDFLDCSRIQAVCIKGQITAIAFALPGVIVEEAIDSIKYDIVMSLRHRFQLLKEDMAESESCHIPKTVTLPLRYFCCDTIAKQGDRIIYSDYILPGEPQDDCMDRIKDNLDIDLQEEISSDQSLPTEKFPVIEIPRPAEEKSEVTKDTKGESSSKPVFIAGVAIATAIATLAWLFSEIGLN